MKGSVSILRVSIAILFSLVIVAKGADFSGITCDFTLTDLSDFEDFIADPNGLTGYWIGNKNVCFQEGQYDISSISTYWLESQQTWYGAQYLADPTCGGSFSPSCARAVSGKALDTTKETVIYYNPTSQFTSNAFSSGNPFSMIGFSLYNSNGNYNLFYLTDETILINNYFFTPDGTGSSGTYTYGLLSTFTLTNNWFDGSGSGGSTTFMAESSGLVSNNYFTSNIGFVVETQYDSDTVTVTGNVFLGSSGSRGIFIFTGTLIVHNNTFIAPDFGIYLDSFTSVVIDGNLFVFSYSDTSSDGASSIYIGSTSHQVNITNNVFVGPEISGISGANPYYLAYNDFSESEINLTPSTWDVSAAHVYNNYFGPFGPYNYIQSTTPSGNTRIPNVYVATASSSIVPFTTTPNHPSLIPPPLISVDWNVSGVDRPYFLVNDQTTFTYTYSIPSWYNVYNIPSSYFTKFSTVQIKLFAGAESFSILDGAASINFGVNTYTYSISSGTLQSSGTEYGYFFAALFLGTTYSTPAKSIFTQEPVNITLNTLPVGGFYSSDQGAITANIYTDSTIKNISLGFISNNTGSFHQFLFLSNGTGSTQSYTIPVNTVKSGSAWLLAVNFTLPSGQTWEVKDTHTFNYVVKADCNMTVYLNKRYNTTVHPNIKKYCPSTPYSKIAWYDSELSDNKGTVSVNSNSTYFIVTPYQNRSGIATWNYGVRLSDGSVSNFTATLIITSANPTHTQWSNITWNLEDNHSINLTQNIADLVSYSSFPVQITGLYSAPNEADSSNTEQVDAMSLYLKKQKAVLVGKSDGTLSLYKAVVTNGQASAGAPITSGFSSHWTFQVSLWAGDEDLSKTSDTASITLYVN